MLILRIQVSERLTAAEQQGLNAFYVYCCYCSHFFIVPRKTEIKIKTIVCLSGHEMFKACLHNIITHARTDKHVLGQQV